MPPQLRPRNAKGKASSAVTFSVSLDKPIQNTPRPITTTPPIYTINLSLPLSQRYTTVATAFAPTLQSLLPLFDDITRTLLPSFIPLSLIHFLASLFLRHLHSPEQTQELHGISAATTIPLYLLIAYNVFLDLLMGCTSGGVRVQHHPDESPRMLHFRTLDWGMPALREVLVQYEFVEWEGGPVVARTLGYVGFVGVLTGVREGVSVSLNFRPGRNGGGWWGWYVWHLVMVVLGWRPSVAARLKDLVMPCAEQLKQERGRGKGATVEEFVAGIRGAPTAVAYLVLCDGEETVVMEKDFCTANVFRSSDFISATNHDKEFEAATQTTIDQTARSQHDQRYLGIGMQDLIDESMERKQCLVAKWEAWQQKQTRKRSRKGAITERSSIPGLQYEELKQWVQEYPICNEETHFVCIMDPAEGTFKWVRSFEEGELGPGNGSEDES